MITSISVDRGQVVASETRRLSQEICQLRKQPISALLGNAPQCCKHVNHYSSPEVLSDGVRLHCGQEARTPLFAPEFRRTPTARHNQPGSIQKRLPENIGAWR
jgi:hypothetical protein